MNATDGLPPLRDVIRRHDLSARKSLGQNFLLDLNLTGRIARAAGPLSADTLFHAEARATYDAAVAMYHDQALIAIKTLAFDRGVNVTLGLPFVRTSPDHGTAFALAGTGKARPDSFIAALRMAHEIGLRRAAARAALPPHLRS